MKLRNASLSLILFISIATATAAQDTKLISGLAIGADCPAFDPRHVSGPDKGTKACPMCKYGYQQGVMIWMNTDDWKNIGVLASALEQEIRIKGLKRMRVFLMYMNPDRKNKTDVEKLLEDFSAKYQLDKVAVTYITDPADPETAGLYNINPDKDVKNTIFVYKSRGIFDKIINFDATASSIQKLVAIVEKAEKTRNF